MSLTYLVAYPHPAICPAERIKQLELGPTTSGKTLLRLLQQLYPDYSNDLQRAKLRKVTGLSSVVLLEDSLEKAYDWIRHDDPATVIMHFELMCLFLPEGARDESVREVNIVAVTPEIIDAMDFQGTGDGTLRLMRARETLRELMKTTTSPSESIKSFASISAAVESPSGPRYGRPSDRFGPPTVLFSRELALLKYDLEHLNGLIPDSTGATLAFGLIERAAYLFSDEGERKAALQSILERLLVCNSQCQTLVADGSDEAWAEETFARPIVGIGGGSGFGGDPFLQSLIVYSKALTQKKCRPFLDRSNLPVVLLTIVGNRLVVSTAVYTDSIYADELLSIDLRLGHHASDNVVRVARAFMAINRCTERLRALYRILGTNPRSASSAKVMWPDPTPDPPLSGRWTEELEFFSKVNRSLGTPINQTIDEDNKRHAIYLARMRAEGGSLTTVLVKFTPKYNEVAHKILAKHNPPLAPALHYCATVIGDMHMTVMEYVPAKSLHFVSRPLSTSALEAINRDVSKALELLHEQELVHGDLREANVLYLPGGGGRALLVDFDGVGRDGDDRYSACLNPNIGLGVGRLQIMEKSHDTKNLERLMGRLSLGL